MVNEDFYPIPPNVSDIPLEWLWRAETREEAEYAERIWRGFSPPSTQDLLDTFQEWKTLARESIKGAFSNSHYSGMNPAYPKKNNPPVFNTDPRDALYENHPVVLMENALSFHLEGSKDIEAFLFVLGAQEAITEAFGDNLYRVHTPPHYDDTLGDRRDRIWNHAFMNLEKLLVKEPLGIVIDQRAANFLKETVISRSESQYPESIEEQKAGRRAEVGNILRVFEEIHNSDNVTYETFQDFRTILTTTRYFSLAVGLKMLDILDRKIVVNTEVPEEIASD